MTDHDKLATALPFLPDTERTEYLEECLSAKQQYEADEIVRETKAVLEQRLVDIIAEQGVTQFAKEK